MRGREGGSGEGRQRWEDGGIEKEGGRERTREREGRGGRNRGTTKMKRGGRESHLNRNPATRGLQEPMPKEHLYTL